MDVRSGFRTFRLLLPSAISPSDLRRFQLPNVVYPNASSQHTRFARSFSIRKLSTCDGVFGALSTDGELFIFPSPESKTPSTGEKVVIKPQLVWALRKAFTGVKVSEGASITVGDIDTSLLGLLYGS